MSKTKFKPLDSTGKPCRKQTLPEEMINSFLHLFGGILSLVGCYLLIQHGNGNVFKIENSITLENLKDNADNPSHGMFSSSQEYKISLLSYVIFTLAMVNTFFTSGFYHGVQKDNIKVILQRLDHSAVLTLIAGSYAPFCLMGVKGYFGWMFLVLEFLLAIAGTYLFYIRNTLFLKLETLLVVLMGWLFLLVVPLFYRSLPFSSFAWLLYGGVVYSLGVIPFAMDNYKGAHSVWHVFVMGGSFCHWVSVLLIK